MAIHSYPPHVAVANRPLSLEEAQKSIANYLATSETSAHLHPDALLSTSGVQFATAGGPMGGIVLHNLRRVEAGLRGEVIKPEPEASDDMVLDGMIEETEQTMQAEGGASKKSKKGASGAEEGWQDMGDYQREQLEEGNEVGELGQRSNFVEQGEEPKIAEGGKSKVDKEARKKAKKERERQQKLEKEAKKKQGAEA
ncbi:uncharacterized protein K452DRAFT_298365 [Aplosporella prunicola CBS 121167]|uniref:Uncharacterized protein n=1 Tax=Aplosporella prunicola CBS 121167 TaxID=1176127 RepID=A0A6A6BEI9_9PEZI|nr:uncharacterized protein K452DRAFT_298365 [Aplosporella prunicola CBS 121167]KAF2141694.1 hypothetical protein K452DRAFT_298365 [Aplosporella prunicola CBS 121167]